MQCALAPLPAAVQENEPGSCPPHSLLVSGGGGGGTQERDPRGGPKRVADMDPNCTLVEFKPVTCLHRRSDSFLYPLLKYFPHFHHFHNYHCLTCYRLKILIKTKHKFKQWGTYCTQIQKSKQSMIFNSNI